MKLLVSIDGVAKELTVTMTELKQFIRQLEGQGYARKPKHYNKYEVDVRANGGLPLIKSTAGSYSLVSFYLK